MAISGVNREEAKRALRIKSDVLKHISKARHKKSDIKARKDVHYRLLPEVLLDYYYISSRTSEETTFNSRAVEIKLYHHKSDISTQ